MKYRAILSRRQSGGFIVSLPAFPGVTATGETEEAALAAARSALVDAISFEVEHRNEHEPPRPHVQIDVNKGLVSREGRSVQLRGVSLALMVALATHPGEISRAELCARLYPGAAAEQAYNALKMSIHRARQQLGGNGAIETTEGGYKLADDAIVDIRFLPQVLRAIRNRSIPRAIEERLPQIFEDLYVGRPAVYSSWEWFAPTERVLQRVMREIGLYLGDRALKSGNPVAALDMARRLITRDLLDEGAYDLAIRAHLARGNRASALMEYRSFAGRLEAEMGMEPSPELQRLVENAPS